MASRPYQFLIYFHKLTPDLNYSVTSYENHDIFYIVYHYRKNKRHSFLFLNLGFWDSSGLFLGATLTPAFQTEAGNTRKIAYTPGKASLSVPDWPNRKNDVSGNLPNNNSNIRKLWPVKDHRNSDAGLVAGTFVFTVAGPEMTSVSLVKITTVFSSKFKAFSSSINPILPLLPFQLLIFSPGCI
jgi:hypothetical protein